MTQAKWKKSDAKATLERIAIDVSRAFAIDIPKTFMSDGATGLEWEYRFATVQVWTKAGPAELSVDIDAGFAHMYFRFDDPDRARLLAPGDRLNRHSGKWNRLASSAHGYDGLKDFADSIAHDFARVAEPAPCPAELAAWKAKQAAEAAQWAEWRAEFAARGLA